MLQPKIIHLLFFRVNQIISELNNAAILLCIDEKMDCNESHSTGQSTENCIAWWPCFEKT